MAGSGAFKARQPSKSMMTANDSGTPEQKTHQKEVDLTITDAIPVDITVLAADGTVLFVNQYALDRLGLSAHDVKDKGYLRQTCHPDDLGRVLDERRIGHLHLVGRRTFTSKLLSVPSTQRSRSRGGR